MNDHKSGKIIDLESFVFDKSIQQRSEKMLQARVAFFSGGFKLDVIAMKSRKPTQAINTAEAR